MKENKNKTNDVDNQDIEMNGEAAFDDAAPSPDAAADTSEDATGANMTDESDEMADSAENAPSNAPENAPENANSPAYEAALWKEKYMRLSAEYENYRKRTFKEKMDIIAAGGEDVVRSMLEVLDDMDRALAAMAKTDDLDAIKQGITLIDNKLRGALKSRGLAEIEAAGHDLDTDLHEAIARIATEDKALKGKILEVVQKGYKLKDQIIRYAKVVVGQ
jgi:molecular chaperone GrpE